MAKRPSGSNWGDYGPNDRHGRLNELTPQRVVRAAEEIRTGQRFCLSLPLDYPGGNVLNPYRFPPERRWNDFGGKAAKDYLMSSRREGTTGVVNDDIVLMYTQYSTQWDAFSHIGSHFDANGDGEAEICYYNGTYPGPDVEDMATACIQGRGVMVDLHRRFGNERVRVDRAMLEDVMREQKVTVEAGDILALHTGLAQIMLEMHKNPTKEALHGSCAVLDGHDPALLEWITESGVAAIVADNYAVEGYPSEKDSGKPYWPLHEHCLFKLGIHLGEIWYLTELARWLRDNGRFRFFLTAPPLRLPGHVGSPANAIATV
jgi:kynurenine formamidase